MQNAKKKRNRKWLTILRIAQRNSFFPHTILQKPKKKDKAKDKTHSTTHKHEQKQKNGQNWPSFPPARTQDYEPIQKHKRKSSIQLLLLFLTFKYPSSRVQTRPKPSGFFRAKKILSTPSFRREAKPWVPRRRFAACKRSLNWRGSRNLRQNFRLILAHIVPPFATRISRVVGVRGGICRWTWEHPNTRGE